jgi:cytochrome P450
VQFNAPEPANSGSALDERNRWFERMRRDEPVSYDDRMGAWSVFRYADVQRALFDHEAFSSDLSAGAPPEYRDAMASSMIAIDPPRHHRLRALVSKAFTPRAVANLAPRIEELSGELLAAIGDRRAFDLVESFAIPLPVIVIAELLGIPSEDREQFRRWSNAIVGSAAETMSYSQAQRELGGYFFQAMEERRRQPRGDLITALLDAEIDGERLSPMELLGFCVLLLVAGNETTTNLIGNAVYCFSQQPGLLADLSRHLDALPLAIEEVLRYLSPVQMLPNRVATRDVTLDGKTIPAGQQVTVWIASANRDEAKFADPDQFRPDRSPNAHLAFGSGVHFCLGAPLARLEATTALTSVIRRFPTLTLDVTNLTLLPGGIVGGFKRLPVSLPR